MPERDEPLLRPVVQVALELAALGVGGRDDPGARPLDLGKLHAHLDAQPRDLDRQRRRAHDALEGVRAQIEGRVVEDHAELELPAADRRADADRVLRWHGESPGRVCVAAAGRQAEEDLQAAIVERLREDLADPLGLLAARANVVEEAFDEPQSLVAAAGEATVDGPLQPVARRTECHRDRHRRERRRPARAAPQHDADEDRHGA